MDKQGPIVIIEDDMDDWELLRMIFSELKYPNRVVHFPDADSALAYLSEETVHPFLIFMDMHLPVTSGLAVRELFQSNELVTNKCVPYIFFSTDINPNMLVECYKTSVQGVFQKPLRYQDFKDMIDLIVRYWSLAMTPKKNLY